MTVAILPRFNSQIKLPIIRVAFTVVLPLCSKGFCGFVVLAETYIVIV